MSRNLYQCTAADLATQDPDAQTVGATVAETRNWLDENGYDVAPIHEDDTPVGFVTRTELETKPGGKPIEDVLREITLEYILTPDVEFGDLLSALYDSQFYFLGGRSHLLGIITRADLNTSPAYIHLFDRIALLEEHFRDVIQQEAPTWKADTPVSVGAIADIEERYADASAANIELDEIHYAQFSTLTTIIAHVEACWRACGFASDHTASSQLHKVTTLRNAVAHSNLLIENTDRGIGERGRTITELEEIYNTIQSCLDVLSDNR